MAKKVKEDRLVTMTGRLPQVARLTPCNPVVGI